MEETSKWCKLCAKNGLRSRKRCYQLNLEEAVEFCENDQCVDLLKTADINGLIFSRKASAFAAKKRKAGRKKTSDDHVANSNGCTSLDDTLLPTTSGSPHSLYSESVTSSTPDLEFEELLNNLHLDMSDGNSNHFTFQKNSLANAVEALEQQLQETEKLVGVNSKLKPKPEFIPAIALQQHSSSQHNCDTAVSAENHQVEAMASCKVLLGKFGELEVYASNDCSTQAVDGTQPASNVSDLVIKPIIENFAVVQSTLPVFANNSIPLPNKNLTKYPQWENKDALCWLDVSLNLLVHNATIRERLLSSNEDSVVKKICTVYDQAFSLLNWLHQNLVNSQNPLAPANSNCSITPEDALFHINMVTALMEEARDQAFGTLQKKLRCFRGQEESPVFALPHLLKDFQDEFLGYYQLDFKCEICGFQETRSIQKFLMTIPRVPDDFSVLNASILASCMKCKSLDQQRRINFKRLPRCVLMHFVEGIPSPNVGNYDFQFQGFQYNVTCIIQYTRNPNHFIAWIHNIEEGKWMQCDDLKPGPSTFCEDVPIMHPNECHIMLWERASQPVDSHASSNSFNSYQSIAPTVDNEPTLTVLKIVQGRIERIFNDHVYCCDSSVFEKKSDASESCRIGLGEDHEDHAYYINDNIKTKDLLQISTSGHTESQRAYDTTYVSSAIVDKARREEVLEVLAQLIIDVCYKENALVETTKATTEIPKGVTLNCKNIVLRKLLDVRRDSRHETKRNPKPEVRRKNQLSRKLGTSLVIRPDLQMEARMTAALNARQDSKPDAKVCIKQDLWSDGRLDVKPSMMLGIRPDASLDGRLDTKLNNRPVNILDGRPNVRLAFRPDARLACRPVARVDCRPEARVDCRPEARVDCRPEARVDCRFDAKLGGRPYVRLNSLPDRRLDSVPDRRLNGVPDVPDRIVDGVPDRMVDGVPDRIVGCLPERMMGCVPDRLVECVPDRMVECVPERVVECVPDRMVECVPDRMVECVPDRMVECVPDRMVECVPDRMVECVPDRMVECVPDRMMECMPDRMVDYVPDRMVDCVPDRMVDCVPDRMVDCVPDRMMDCMPDRRLNTMPDRRLDDMSEWRSDGMPDRSDGRMVMRIDGRLDISPDNELSTDVDIVEDKHDMQLHFLSDNKCDTRLGVELDNRLNVRLEPGTEARLDTGLETGQKSILEIDDRTVALNGYCSNMDTADDVSWQDSENSASCYDHTEIYDEATWEHCVSGQSNGMYNCVSSYDRLEEEDSVSLNNSDSGNNIVNIPEEHIHIESETAQEVYAEQEDITMHTGDVSPFVNHPSDDNAVLQPKSKECIFVFMQERTHDKQGPVVFNLDSEHALQKLVQSLGQSTNTVLLPNQTEKPSEPEPNLLFSSNCSYGGPNSVTVLESSNGEFGNSQSSNSGRCSFLPPIDCFPINGSPPRKRGRQRKRKPNMPLEEEQISRVLPPVCASASEWGMGFDNSEEFTSTCLGLTKKGTPRKRNSPAKRKSPAKPRAPPKPKAPAKPRAPRKPRTPAKPRAPPKAKSPAKPRARKVPNNKFTNGNFWHVPMGMPDMGLIDNGQERPSSYNIPNHLSLLSFACKVKNPAFSPPAGVLPIMEKSEYPVEIKQEEDERINLLSRWSSIKPQQFEGYQLHSNTDNNL